MWSGEERRFDSRARAIRLPVMDALRGMAALTIVVFHYQHFLQSAAELPYGTALRWLYRDGASAVPLFFMLSGYLFFSLYAEPIGSRRLGGASFFLLRFARLYPLHLVTLCAVAVLQYAVYRATGATFAVANNDLAHFLENLALVQFGWGNNTPSFNGPAWSVAAEASLYFAFFVFARRFGPSLTPRLLVCALFVELAVFRSTLPTFGPFNGYMSEAAACFFLGGCLNAASRLPPRAARALGLVLLGAAVLGLDAVGVRRALVFLGFPGLILVLSATPILGRLCARGPLAWLGDVSYSIYLWHFPVQLGLVLFAATIAPIDFSAPFVFWLFLALVLTLGGLSYRRFEMPARAAIRRRFLAPGGQDRRAGLASPACRPPEAVVRERPLRA